MLKRIVVSFNRHGFRNLLVGLILYNVLTPFLEPYMLLSVIAHLLLCITLFLSLYAIERHDRLRTVAAILLIPLLISYWLGLYNLVIFSRQGSYLLMVGYYSLLIYVYVKQLARFKKVNLEALYGALCLYLIIGLFWGGLYALLHEIQPGSYGGNLLASAKGSTLEIFNYFSMVTLTTLGYGDIVPKTAAAGVLCVTEAVVGQFFTAVVVGWMVGNIVSERRGL